MLTASRERRHEAAAAGDPSAVPPASAQAPPAPDSDVLCRMSRPRLRSVAFYLPQFHPIPENDAWWGTGFTEWTNVAKARPRFRGHRQPRLPSDLGFYDLRVPEVRARQAELALDHGIQAFCYYHYWFGGRRLLERPFAEVLASGEPSIPFLLCWANENWTRAWDGGSSEILVEQTYSADDDLAHVRWLCAAFSDRRYLRVDGKPVFLVYKASALPSALRTTDLWRSEAQRLGIGELYLLRVESFQEPYGDPTRLGFDGAVEFQPDTRRLGPRLPSPAARAATRVLMPRGGRHRNVLHRYSDLVDRSLDAPIPAYKRYRCVTPAWDNSPRRSPALIMTGAEPGEFQRWLAGVSTTFRPYSATEDLLFLNAWNEWAEGAQLEPCDRHGRALLEAHRHVLAS